MPVKSTKAAAKPATASAAPRNNHRTINLELVRSLAPTPALAQNLIRTFGLDDVDFDGIREATLAQFTVSSEAFGSALNERALEIHLQRITGAFVSSAYGAAVFYGSKVTAARDLTTAGANDDRDEDRDGVFGFDSKAQRARQFAAEMGRQAYALLAAAEGAVAAYAEITGTTWKPYEAPLVASATVSRQSAAVELAALGVG